MDPNVSVIYALDFDGVICDTVGETCISAIMSAARFWPQLNLSQDRENQPQWMLDAMRQVRPVIMTGYEAVLLARLLSETTEATVQTQFILPILANWQDIRDQCMEEWKVGKDELVKAFGGVRDDWINNELHTWLGANKMFVAL